MTADEHRIQRVTEAGQLAALAHTRIRPLLRSGTRTEDIDTAIEAFLRGQGATPAFKGYRGFPAASAISVNAEMLHGLPSAYVLAEGDLVTVDVGVRRLGYFAEKACTYGIASISPAVQALIEAARTALEAGIAAARAGNRSGAVGAAIAERIQRQGFTAAQSYGGHGIGKRLHETPFLPLGSDPQSGVMLTPGITLAIESIACVGTGRSRRAADRWTVVSDSGAYSAHFEETVVVTALDARVLTLLEDR